MKIAKKSFFFSSIILLAIVSITGCGGEASDENKPSPEKTDGDTAAKLTGPAAAAYAFLDAARRGDDAGAMAMLTPIAREEIGKLKLNVAPAGSDTAKFVVGEVKNVSEEIAHVASRWTDVDREGKPQSHEMTWILRHVEEGWRVGGMATIVFEGEPPLLLNFEQPQEMLRQKEMLREEVARRNNLNK